MVSAHWETQGAAATAMEAPRTIHDFTGFPQPLYDIRYPAPGDAALVARVEELIAPAPLTRDDAWGLDHGTWSVLMHTFPNADIPIVQLSLDRTLSADQHIALARRLAPLRDEGVLIAGSGDIVHNLRLALRTPNAPPLDWAMRFNERVKDAIARDDLSALSQFAPDDADAARSIPTAEHYLPLLYVLAQRAPGEAARFFTDAIDMGAISMTGVRIG